MALSDREEVFDVEVPAGTAKATPIEHSITFPPGTVVELQILFPAGCAGLVGVALAQAHQPVFPRAKGAFVRGDNETVTREVTGYNNTGDWQLFGYNTDSNLHTVQVRFAVVENIKVTPTAGPPGTVAVGPSGEVEPAPTLETAPSESPPSGEAPPTPPEGEKPSGEGEAPKEPEAPSEPPAPEAPPTEPPAPEAVGEAPALEAVGPEPGAEFIAGAPAEGPPSAAVTLASLHIAPQAKAAQHGQFSAWFALGVEWHTLAGTGLYSAGVGDGIVTPLAGEVVGVGPNPNHDGLTGGQSVALKLDRPWERSRYWRVEGVTAVVRRGQKIQPRHVVGHVARSTKAGGGVVRILTFTPSGAPRARGAPKGKKATAPKARKSTAPARRPVLKHGPAKHVSAPPHAVSHPKPVSRPAPPGRPHPTPAPRPAPHAPPRLAPRPTPAPRRPAPPPPRPIYRPPLPPPPRPVARPAPPPPRRPPPRHR